MECFSVDESGYTGFDLLNDEQRFQGASAVCITQTDAQLLISRHFPNLHADELKYRSLVKRPINLEKLLNLQKDLLHNYKCVTYVCDKRYLLILMFLDYAVEPFYYAKGINFYEDGQNYALASLLYYIKDAFWGTDFDTLLSAFQSAIKLKTNEAIKKLIQTARHMEWKKFPEVLAPLVYNYPDCISDMVAKNVSTDAALIVLQSLISRMELLANGEYRVDHDKSKNLMRYHKILEKLIEHKDVIEFRQSQLATIKFPLKLVSVSQVDSKDSPSVQLADVLIGAAIDAFNALNGFKRRSTYTDEILPLYADQQIIHMLPNIDFDEQMEFRRGTQADQVINYFAKNFSRFY